ncbi:hypothetical protein Scep_012342 [Stephania cephalantha]|uniref:Uncharacterized protein n=1 Tax=Stephania cephalantha TaxID=152367 RepID=A0AAP0JEZ4_9MAGN
MSEEDCMNSSLILLCWIFCLNMHTFQIQQHTSCNSSPSQRLPTLLYNTLHVFMKSQYAFSNLNLCLNTDLHRGAH